MDKSILSFIANESFIGADGKKDRAKQLSEHQAAQKAEYAKTAKLRKLRLAKEAADHEKRLAAGVQVEPRKTKLKAASKHNTSNAPKARRSISWGR